MSIEQYIEQLKTRTSPLYPQSVWKPELSIGIERDVNDEIVRAGLLLWNDDLEASHHVSQSIETPTGSFWHAIMHRREGDAANSHYWWRKTGEHPAFAAIHERVLKLLETQSDEDSQEFARVLREAETWPPMEFVARCELARRGQMDAAWLERVQVIEIETLLDWCRANRIKIAN